MQIARDIREPRVAGNGIRPVPTREGWELETGWQMEARCRGADANLFFTPNHLEKKEEREEREAMAKGLCAECPVRAQCFDFALATREPHGIWGGLNELERRALLTKRAG